MKTYDMRILHMELILSIAKKKDSKNSSYNFGYLKKIFSIFQSINLYWDVCTCTKCKHVMARVYKNTSYSVLSLSSYHVEWVYDP